MVISVLGTVPKNLGKRTGRSGNQRRTETEAL